MTTELLTVLTICLSNPREKAVGKEGVKRKVELIKRGEEGEHKLTHAMCQLW